MAALVMLAAVLSVAGQGSQVFAAGRAAAPQEPLTSIRMLDYSNGWALTDSKILKTRDGGWHWQNVTPSGTVLNRLAKADFMNSQYAWVANIAVGGNIEVLRTADGGIHWQQVQIANTAGAYLTDMPHFLNANDGWLSFSVAYGMSSGILGDVYHTTDGGLHWSKLADYTQVLQGLYINGQASGISLKDANNIWYTEDPFDMNNLTGASTLDHAFASVSHDGGKSWHLQQFPTIPGLKNAHYTTTPPLFFGQQGIMPVYVYTPDRSVSGLCIYTSNDGGNHWYTQQFTNFTPNMVNLADPAHIYADTRDGRVFATNDGGLHWFQVTSTGVIGDLSFIDSHDGFFITATSNQYLLRTSDGGHNWQRINYTIS
ncbi:hypothetical protein KDK_55250 [Dictyobacter kobayashii]|uniref:Photosynthesis system II assembly factor Ycf48/Hcf136-like domain-containing protein n=1 Tax=Dictyobacter kobayashii TaxID=2014872 RepID=A0A402ARK0_9CHLR|nr:hypothetical protein KDK_55250 [Dictyobacter kobayashii]